MAFPVAHGSLGCGIAKLLGQKVDSLAWLLFWFVLSISPDFDFFFVFILGMNWRQYHRTFSHSLFFSLGASAAIFLVGRAAGWMRGARCWLAMLLVLMSHAALDFLCVSRMPRDGEMLLWPFSTALFGHESFLVPLYRFAGGEPHSLARVALPYTLLELVLWSPMIFWILRRPGIRWPARMLEELQD